MCPIHEYIALKNNLFAQQQSPAMAPILYCITLLEKIAINVGVKIWISKVQCLPQRPQEPRR